MRVAGTRNAIASAFTDMPSGARNSSPSTSPGWVVTRFGVATPLVVVDDFDIGGPLLGPGETDAPLVVDPDRMLSAAVSRECFEPVCRRRAQVVEAARIVKHIELAQCRFLDAAESLHERAHQIGRAS